MEIFIKNNLAWSLALTAYEFNSPVEKFIQAFAAGLFGAAILHRSVKLFNQFDGVTHANIQFVFSSWRSGHKLISLGGGCIWNDIVDCDLDKRVGKQYILVIKLTSTIS